MLRLSSKRDSLVELTVHFAQGGHVNAVGRLRVVVGNYSQPCVWVGEVCLPINVGVSECTYDNASKTKFNLYQNRDGSWPMMVDEPVTVDEEIESRR